MFTCSHTIAQQVSLFQSIGTQDGLPSNYIMAIEEDANGYLWLGTDKGLAKYDGFSWKTFTTDDGLPGNYIGFIKKASTNGLWIGISDKGLYHFNLETKKATPIAQNSFHHFYQTDKNDNLFFYAMGDKPNDTKGYWVSPQRPQQINKAFEIDFNKSIKRLAVDFSNKLIFLIGDNGNTTNQNVTIVDKSWQVKKVKGYFEEPSLYEPVDASVFESLSSLYVTHASGGVNRVQLFSNENIYFNSLTTPDGYWINNEKDGLYFINKNFEKTHYTTTSGLSSNRVVSMHRLSNGKMLFGTLGGGLCYKLPQNSAQLYINEPVKGLAQNGNQFFALTNKNIYSFSEKQEQAVHVFSINQENVQGLNVWDNDWFVSGLHGYTRYRQNGNTITPIYQQPLGAGISNVVKDNNEFFAGTYGAGLCKWVNGKLVEDSGSLTVIEKLQPIKNGMAALNYEDGLQLIFNNGQKKNITTKNGLPSNTVYDVHEYKDTLWISTRKGVAAWAGNKIVKNISAAQGLLGNRCLFSFHDRQQNLWTVTDEYLCRWDGSKIITNTTIVIKNGRKDNITACLFDTISNTLVTGTQEAVFINQLNNTGNTNRFNFLPVLVAVTKNNQPVFNKSSFTLSPQYGSIKFQLQPYSNNPFSKSVLYYKLQGLHTGFVELKDSLIISFTKLGSGNYTLIAKLVDENGIAGKEVILSRFTVNKPLWQKAWFIALLVLATAGISYVLASYLQKRKLKQKEKELLLEKQLLNERERISRELHDNLGSSMVTMIAQADNIETKLRNHQTDEALKKATQLSDQSRETMNLLRETIWAVQEQSHSYANFMSRISNFLQRTYAATNIECSYNHSGTLTKELTPEQTLNLFRCVQEATQNIIKHSGADKADYLFNAEKNSFSISISDNGKGFDPEQQSTGNGLKNIENRIKELNGKLSITSSEAGGSNIKMEVSI